MLGWVRGFVLPTCGNKEDGESNLCYENLFWQLDRYGTGKVDIIQRQEASCASAPRPGALKTGDTEKDVKPVFDEFKKYIKNHGKKLKLTFKSLDKSDSSMSYFF
uniref:Uncharacterized protein n=1 Tax=Vombatus ursinus TaxID=29139 RepID=A0A4X2L9P9_VOMUR